MNNGGISHIMLVDDEDDYHLITRMMLKKAGFHGKLTTFLDPDEALQHLRNGQELPELLLVDINMPCTTGFEFLADCEKETLFLCKDTTVVMCSSSNRPVDMNTACDQYCVRDYVEKPLTVEAFERINDEYARRNHA